jgi:co-chaperonin GroES (HSP10)
MSIEETVQPTMQNVQRTIHPLGEQIIIRAIPMADKLGSIVVPDSAKKTTMMGDKGDAVHFVEAVVIAVGPGRRAKGDVNLIPHMITGLREAAEWIGGTSGRDADGRNPAFVDQLYDLARKAQTVNRIPPMVKPGDRIIYHPSVQKFDRKLEQYRDDGDYFIILENSVLAVIEP